MHHLALYMKKVDQTNRPMVLAISFLSSRVGLSVKNLKKKILEANFPTFSPKSFKNLMIFVKIF